MARKTKRTPMMDYNPAGEYVGNAMRSQSEFNLSDLVIKHIEAHIKSGKLYDEQLASVLTSSGLDGVPALTTIAMNSMINSLRQDPSPSNFETVISHAPESLLSSIIDSPKLHYTSVLRFMEQKGWDKLKDDSKRDIWILKNENFMRADGTDWGLLNLEDADIVFAHSSTLEKNEAGEPTHRLITRKIGPKAGLQFLDQRRPRTIKIQPSTDAYKKAFDRLMNGALDGLDWNNVIVAGGMALSTLLAVDESMDDKYKENDLDMYIYGLTPAKANEKLKHITEVWKKNLPAGMEPLIIKNAKTVTLISDYPHRRVQIILKMVKNPAAVLVNFDLDQVAIAYTGESVLMLPRCARALETGYSIFTMEMIHGHHLNGRRETQEERLFKYAHRGFGVRILPEFCEMVEIDFSRRKETIPYVDQTLGNAYRNRWSGEVVDAEESGDDEPTYYSRRNKKPKESDILTGIKAVRRVFAAGEDMVYRFYLGRTEVTAPEDYDDYDSMLSDDDGPYSGYYLEEITDSVTGEKRKVPKGEFSALDTYRSGVGVPHGKRGLGSLEMHARHCALFRFEAEQKMIVEYSSLASLTYEVETYDMLPQYGWNQGFDKASFARDIDNFNDSLFSALCDVMGANPAFMSGGFEARKNNCEFLEDDQAPGNGFLWRRGGWRRNTEDPPNILVRGYLTRRIRRVSHSKDINELVDRFQIVVPVVLPFKLEEWIKEQFAQAIEDAGFSSSEHEIIIPVHKPGMGDGSLPDLQESTEENLRFWIIDSTTMWAGIDRRIDEIHEVLWILVTASQLVSDFSMGYANRADAFKEWFEIIAGFLLRRTTKLSIQQLGVEGASSALAEVDTGSVEGANVKSADPLTVPNERDHYLFTKWLMERPVEIYRNYQYQVRDTYRESNNETAPPEIMYWRDDIQVENNKEWTDWPEDVTEGTQPIATFRKMPKPKREPEEDDEDDDAGNGDSNDAEGEAAAPAEASTENANDGPRGIKRQREDSDLNVLNIAERADQEDTSMADAPGSSR